MLDDSTSLWSYTDSAHCPVNSIGLFNCQASLLSPEHLLTWLKPAGTPSTRPAHAESLWPVLTWIQGIYRHSSYTVNVALHKKRLHSTFFLLYILSILGNIF